MNSLPSPRAPLGLVLRLSMGLTAILAVAGRPASASIVINQTTDSATLRSALGGSGLTIDSVSVASGVASQFGTYSNFSQIGDGVVLSSGNVVDLQGPPSPDDMPATDLGQPGTAEFDAYGLIPGHIDNFSASFDVASLRVDFTLDSASAVAFSFVFGSIEYPNWVSNFTDSFLVFLDGTSPADQVTFDSNGVPVQVGEELLQPDHPEQ